jgi:1-acyl-sn-glycerol-3-phosphate acyltransferase
LQTLGDAVALVQELRKVKEAPQPADTGSTAQPRNALRRSFSPSRGLILHFGPAIAQAIMWCAWNARATGQELIPQKGSTIFAANHQSLLDIPLIIAALPWEIRRRTYIIGKMELTRIAVFGALVRRSNLIAVEREGEVTEAINMAIHLLRSGGNIIIFPEGTRTRTGKMGNFKPGLGTLLLETNAAVCPIKINGAFEAWPAGKRPLVLRGRSTRPTATFGSPVTLSSLIHAAKLPSHPTAGQLSGAIRTIINLM